MTDELSDARLDEIEASLEHVTAGPWAYLACGEKDNSWQVGLWTRPDETAIEGEVNDDDAERYETAGFPDAWEEHAVCIETVCENVDAMASLSDASFIAESRTLVPRLVAALRSARRDNQVLRENATWNEEDAAELERVGAELERERTQNLAWRALVDASEPVFSSAHDVLLGIDAGLAGRCVSVLGRIDAARAALSTQPAMDDAACDRCGGHGHVHPNRLNASRARRDQPGPRADKRSTRERVEDLVTEPCPKCGGTGTSAALTQEGAEQSSDRYAQFGCNGLASCERHPGARAPHRYEMRGDQEWVLPLSTQEGRNLAETSYSAASGETT